MEERFYWLAWQFLMPTSARLVWTLIKKFGSPENAWKATEDELINIGGLKPEIAADLGKKRNLLDIEREINDLEQNGVYFLTYRDGGYPENLRSIFDPPVALFIRGQLIAADSMAVAIVGSRKPTYYGVSMAEKIARDLATTGVTVVSGMARGIDTAAHRGALATEGRTVAVLGCGLDVVYPRENRRLMEQIASKGAVITEFPPGTQALGWHFPVRNRIISGLSKAIVVVEAGRKSGALITADFALEQGREVMAVPGNVTSPLSSGPHKLIKEGACLVEKMEDILEELNLKSLFSEKMEQKKDQIALTSEEEAVYHLLACDPLPLDVLIGKSELSPRKVMAALMFLEVKGLVRQLPGKFYTLAL